MSQRPLSPHLGIYRPQITSVMSITHRASGVFLSLGAAMLVWWLWAAAYSPECYQGLQEFFGSAIGTPLLFLWTLAFSYHLCNGIRHLYWDAGYGFELEQVTKSGIAVLFSAVTLTLAAWIMA